MANTYAKGQRIRCTAEFKDTTTNAYVDPLTVTFKAKSPGGGTTAYVYGVDPDVIKTATGRYRYDLLLDAAGDWWLRWEGTGSNETAREWRVVCCKQEVL